jgi:squalene-hopene/tetraprenyl-beta-curcumene cyclase
VGVLVLLGSLPAFCADWSPRLAADFLDARQKEWFAWKQAEASGGPCVSCHTGITYLLARPALRRALGEAQPTTYETGLIAGLRARLGNTRAKDAGPPEENEDKPAQSIGVESIVSAFFLARSERAAVMSPDVTRAFERLWSLQLRQGNAKGAWSWFEFDLDPWEAPHSRFYGASLAALALGYTPADYRNRVDVKERISDLIAYLSREQSVQPMHNRLILLWAANKLPPVFPESARKSLITEVLGKQEKDGGWSIQSIGPWKERASAPAALGSSSYATGLVTFTLQRAGLPASHPKIAKALDWLKQHQDKESGFWPGESMNKHYKPGSMQIQFMRDAGTAFASLALVEAGDSDR